MSSPSFGSQLKSVSIILLRVASSFTSIRNIWLSQYSSVPNSGSPSVESPPMASPFPLPFSLSSSDSSSSPNTPPSPLKMDSVFFFAFLLLLPELPSSSFLVAKKIPAAAPPTKTIESKTIRSFFIIIPVPFLIAFAAIVVPASPMEAPVDADSSASEAGMGRKGTISASFMNNNAKNGKATACSFVSVSFSYFSTSLLIFFRAKFRRHKTVPCGIPIASAISCVLISSK